MKELTKTNLVLLVIGLALFAFGLVALPGLTNAGVEDVGFESYSSNTTAE